MSILLCMCVNRYMRKTALFYIQKRERGSNVYPIISVSVYVCAWLHEKDFFVVFAKVNKNYLSISQYFEAEHLKV